MAASDGNGWVQCRFGHRHWGRFGAAGLVLVSPGPGGPQILLQLRAGWTHEGGTWALLGGARDSHEDATEAALREASEEGGIDAAAVRTLGEVVGLDHTDWRYTYVLAAVPAPVHAEVVTAESEELRWVAVRDVADLPLHPAFRAAWGTLMPLVADLPESA